MHVPSRQLFFGVVCRLGRGFVVLDEMGRVMCLCMQLLFLGGGGVPLGKGNPPRATLTYGR